MYYNYINAKLQGFLVLGVQLNLNVFVRISKELPLPNFYRKFIIC